MRDLTDSETEVLEVACRALKALPQDLRALIEFESAWNPLAENKLTHARGLIQFMPKTAQELGYKDAEQLVRLHPTIEAQLPGPVVRYLYRWSPFGNLSRLCMAVFYPKYLNSPENHVFPDWVQAANPGIKTVGDYVAKVRRRLG